MRRIPAMALALACLVSEARADDPGTGEQAIGGLSIQCRDIHGRPVQTFRIMNLGDVGRAGVVSRVPIIAIDPNVMAMLPSKLQLFFYLHECAHHVLGHWMNFSPDNENEADCWAIKYARDHGVLTRIEVEGFAPKLEASKGSAFGHLPGPERQRHLLECYDAKPHEMAAH
jgi:hypothetical protein